MAKRKITLLLALFLIGIPVLAQQDTVRSLIFTEWFGNRPESAFIEITNVGDSTLDLSIFHFSIILGWGWDFDWTEMTLLPTHPSNTGMRLWGELDPGASLVIKNVYDTPRGDGGWRDLPRTPIGFFDVENLLPVHVQNKENELKNFWYKPEWEMWGKDKCRHLHNKSTDCWCKGAHALWYCFPDGSDSVMIDQVRLVKSPDDDRLLQTASDVAGVFEASRNYILVRKASVTEGTLDWELARGIDISVGEWIPILPWLERDASFSNTMDIYTTIGTHGDYGISLSSETVAIDTVANTLTVPWGIMKGDSILDEFDIGPGMAWYYNEDTIDFADSAYSTVQDGDMLRFLAVGNDLEVKDFTIQVNAPPQDMALVFPKRTMRYAAMEEEDFNGVMWGGEPYYVTEDHPVIDTIGDVGFNTRKDTLLKYLAKAPLATWEIVWVDAMERTDLKYGDKLVVTAEDGTTTKEYFIDVQDFEADDNAFLAAITWPDIPFYMEGWAGDTIPNFSPSSTQFQVMLPYGTRSIPALQGILEDLNASLAVSRATNLSGSQAERTTTFTVTAEDDSTTMEYNIVFKIEKPIANTQLYQAEPFISEVHAAKDGSFEIVNVGDVPLDLSQYLFGHTTSELNPAELIGAINPTPDLNAFWWRYGNGYVPGYKFTDDTSDYKVNPGKLYFDPAVDPTIDPGDVFAIGQPIHKNWANVDAILASDVITNYGSAWLGAFGVNWNTWGITNLGNGPQMNLSWRALYLYKIENDSILEGEKEVWENSTDYTLIDAVGDPGTEFTDILIGEHTRALGWTDNVVFRRMPHIYQGNTAMDSTSNVTEWLSNSSKQDAGFEFWMTYQYYGSHSFDPVTVHLSTITSTAYMVSDGYKNTQSIQADFGASTTIETFLSNIDKADTGQVVTIIDGTDGIPKDIAEMLAGVDTVIVESADGKNETRYAIVDLPLDGNALITVKTAYTDFYTVSVDEATGTITGSGIEWGKPVKDILGALEIPELATYSIIDQYDRPVAMKVLNFDTVLVDVRMSDVLFIEVVAQDATTIKYQLLPESMSDEAFVISSVFLVNEDNMTISLIPQGISVTTFMSYVNPVTGAEIMVLDKYGFERSLGGIAYDDKLKVVSEDGTNTVYYYLNYFDEEMPDNNEAPTLSVDITSANVLLGDTLTLKATADDDGMPLPTALTVEWIVVSGEGVTIASPDALETDITFDQTGSVVLQVTVDDGEISRTEIVNVGVSTPDNLAPTVSVANGSMNTEEGTAINVSATADDDGNPVGSSLIYTWTVKTGEAANVTIASPDQLDSEVTFSTAGVYTLQITVTDGELIATDIVVVVVTEAVGLAPVLEPAMSMYPNPVAGILTIELENMGSTSTVMNIINITGQVVYNAEFTESKVQIDVSSFDAGLYFVTVRTGDNRITKKLHIIK